MIHWKPLSIHTFIEFHNLECFKFKQVVCIILMYFFPLRVLCIIWPTRGLMHKIHQRVDPCSPTCLMAPLPAHWWFHKVVPRSRLISILVLYYVGFQSGNSEFFYVWKCSFVFLVDWYFSSQSFFLSLEHIVSFLLSEIWYLLYFSALGSLFLSF